MKALSIQQPYAFAIVNGWKPVENRTWWTNFRGPFLVHTGKKELRDDVAGVLERIAVQTGRDLDEVQRLYKETAKLGGYCGAAVITRCCTRHGSDWFYGPYGFELSDATTLRGFHHIPANGARGFFDVPNEIVIDHLGVWLGAWKHATAAGIKGALR